MRKDLFRQIRICLARKECFALATVIARSGSGPREPGATMLIKKDGETFGTIGGGVLEADAVKISHDVIRASRPACRNFSLTDRQASLGGMICGGQVELLVDYVDGNEPSWGGIMEKAHQRLGAGQAVWFVRSIRQDGIDDQGGGDLREDALWVKVGLGLMDDNRLEHGTLDLAGRDVNLLKKSRRRTETVLVFCGNLRYVIQPAGVSGKVFIFGAGHVARELAPLCLFVGLPVVIIDDRPEFASADRFPTAEEILIPESFDACIKDMEINEDCCIVIVTRGHENDGTVLAQALRTRAGYIGMIGSRGKRDIIYRMLSAKGFRAEDISRVHCPIGLSIGAQTPAEIAVSIVAELIAVRSEQNKPVLNP